MDTPKEAEDPNEGAVEKPNIGALECPKEKIFSEPVDPFETANDVSLLPDSKVVDSNVGAVSWPNVRVCEPPNAEVVVDPYSGAVEVVNVGAKTTKWGVLMESEVGKLREPKAGWLDVADVMGESKGFILNVGCVCCNVLPFGAFVPPNAEVVIDPNSEAVEVPNIGAEAPQSGVFMEQ